MKTLIDTIYDLHLPQPKTADDEEYQTLLDRLIRLEEKITKCLDCREIFDEFQTANGDLHSIANRNEFRRGFRAGALIVFEIFGEGGK